MQRLCSVFVVPEDVYPTARRGLNVGRDRRPRAAGGGVSPWNGEVSGADGAELLFKDRGEVAASWSETARTTSVCALDLYTLASSRSPSGFLLLRLNSL